MRRYQLRLPEPMTLSDWLDELAWALWGAFRDHHELAGINPHAFVRIREILGKVLEQHVTTYDRCGLCPECYEGISLNPWAIPTRFSPDVPTRWYLLEIEQSLGELVSAVTDRLSMFLVDLVGYAIPIGPFEVEVETALLKTIGRYLYRNPYCGTTDNCHTARKLNPWQHDTLIHV